MKVIIQLALDFVDLKRAIKVAKEASSAVDWIEIGTPLIKAEGMNTIREMRKLFPKHTIIADMKTMDAGRTEVEMAAKAGANIVEVLGAASRSTIIECIKAGKNYGVKILVDMLEVRNIEEKVQIIESAGADYIGIHTPIDSQMHGEKPFEAIKKIKRISKLPIAVAGGINSETAADAVKAGANIIIVGGAITKAVDPGLAAKKIRKAAESMRSIETKLFKRAGEKDLEKILSLVSTSNISDAMHRSNGAKDIFPLFKGIKMFGKAITVRTYPGDWAKPVEAIDLAKKGDVIVIDCGSTGPAVWGELATESALQKKISGVVIDGAIRDTPEITKLKFPAFAKMKSPNAGEPKGFGEINIPIIIGGIKVFPGDIVVGDDDGIVIIPHQDAIEIVNRAMDVLEKENRIRKEIKEGNTLSSVTELLKWEKK